MKVTSIGKRIFLTGMVVTTMITATASSMVGTQAASTDNGMELMDLVEVMPDGGTVGSWVIGGETFDADENTEFDTEEAPLEVDACVEVEYEATADGNLALEIKGDDSPDCIEVEDADDEDSEDEESMELMGLVEAMPDGGTVGSWVIGGETFNADENTEFDTEEGLLEVDACVEVEYEATADGNLALEIESDDSPDCMEVEDEDSEDEESMELMGLVEAMPDGGTVGSWVIGGETFNADENTEFNSDKGPLEIDACVEVEYEATADGNLALEIKGDDSPDCMEIEDDDAADPADSTTPANSEGGNAVGTDGTPIRLMSNTADAAPGQDPPVDGSLGTEDPNGAEEDETAEDEAAEDEEADEDEDEGEEVYGIVDVMPAGADMPLGTWVIDGVNYVATADTEVEEEHGPFEVGARVELEFQVVDGVNQLMELETEPAPGEGPNTIAGMIEGKGGAIVAASVTANAAANSTWLIGGTEYTIVSITEMDEQQGALSVGSLAEVNSYTDISGREIATRIRSMEMPVQTEFMFLPLVLQRG